MAYSADGYIHALRLRLNRLTLNKVFTRFANIILQPKVDHAIACLDQKAMKVNMVS